MGKWRRYAPILLCFLCLTAALVYGLERSYRRELTPMQLKFQDERNHLPLVPHYEEAEDAYFLFLPACTDLSDLSITDPITGRPVSFFQRDIPLGTDLSVPSRVLDVKISGKVYSIEVWQCDTLPTLFLQGKPDMLTKVHEDKETKVTAQVKILDETGEILLQDTASLSGRGNGTWAGVGDGQPKRPYNLRFSSPISFGPFEDLDTLCLFAEYSDESKLRNSIAYFAGQELGLDYASAYTYVNVYANGEYLGLYGVATKKEYTKHLEDDGILGVFECTSFYGRHTFYSSFFEQPMKQFYGDPSYAQDIVYEVEAALDSQNWTQCEALIDLDSFALMYAMEEFFCNPDMTYASQYFYINPNGVLHTMLPWDFDFSLGNAVTYFEPNQDRTIIAYRNLFGYSWYPILLQWEGFRQRVADAMEQYFTDEFFEKISSRILQDIQAIDSSRRCDMRRWKNADPYSANPLSSGMETLSEFYNFFTEFFPKRRDFLLNYFQNYDSYCCITLRPMDGIWYNNVCIPKGSRPADYIDEEAFFQRAFPDDPAGQILVTDAGIPLSELDAVSEDLTLIATAP